MFTLNKDQFNEFDIRKAKEFIDCWSTYYKPDNTTVFNSDKLFEKFKDSILVVSYRADGIPSLEELENLLKKYKPDVEELKRKNYKYVLSNNHTEEVLLIAK